MTGLALGTKFDKDNLPSIRDLGRYGRMDASRRVMRSISVAKEDTCNIEGMLAALSTTLMYLYAIVLAFWLASRPSLPLRMDV